MILASDYDGTLRLNELVDQYDIEMIKRWQKAGHYFIVVTGRSMQTFELEMKKNDFHPDFIVTNNGGALYTKDLEQVKVNEIPFEKAMCIYRYLLSTDCSSVVINEGKYRAVRVLDKDRHDNKGRSEGPMSVEEIIEKGRIAQFVVFMEKEEKRKKIALEIEKQFGEWVQPFVNVDCIDIVPRGCDKAKGLAQAIELLKIDGDVYAIGDSYNDLPMIDAYIGCTLEHANQTIKEHADYVLKGVGDAIAFLLNEDK